MKIRTIILVIFCVVFLALSCLFFTLSTRSHNYNINIGDSVSFGAYEQDNDTQNGKEPIKWVVMGIYNDEAVLMSKDVLDFVPFTYFHGVDIYWELSFARDWLNNEFYKTAFSEREAGCIITTQIINNPNPVDKNEFFKSEKNTEDKVYLLSYEELKEYGLSLDYGLDKIDTYEERYEYICTHDDLDYKEEKIERRCTASVYAMTQMDSVETREFVTLENNISVPWALRSKGMGKELNGVVEESGRISLLGVVSSVKQGMRPVIRVNIKNSLFGEICDELNDKEHVFDDGLYFKELKQIDQKNHVSFQDINEKDILLFGNYEQDGNFDNGPEPIEWIVINKSEDDILLFSRYVLDLRKFDEEGVNIYWNDCSLRKWLNDTFYNMVFSEDNKKIIKKSFIDNEIGLEKDDEKGLDYDYIFIPSIEEICDENNCFVADPYLEDINRRCSATVYYKNLIDEYYEADSSRTVYTRNREMAFSYCLRSIVKSYGHNYVYIVAEDGNCSKSAIDIPQGIRPAIRISGFLK